MLGCRQVGRCRTVAVRRSATAGPSDGRYRVGSELGAGVAGHVYVSYGRQDVAYVRRLVEHLAGEGLKVWADENVTPQAWWDASMEPPIRAAAVVLVVMTPASQSSDRVRG